MSIELQPVTTDADLERLLAVRNAVDPRPLTAVAWRAELLGTISTSLAIATLDGRDVGAGSVAWGTMGRDSGLAFIDLWVLPDARRRGVGDRLWTSFTAFARDGGLQRASVVVVDGDAASTAFAEHRGLVATGGGQLGGLDLAAAPPATPPTLPDGVIITTLADRPELERAVFEVERIVRPEIPALAGEPDPTFEAWQADMTSDEGFLRDLCLIAIRDGAVAGVVQVYDGGDSKVFIGMTAIDPASRRMGLARALKQELARRAAARGYERIETYNDGANERIRALNESLGYVYLPRMVILKGPLPAP